MNSMFEWQEQYLTSERSEQVRLFLPREHTIHIFEPTCNVLLLYGDFILNNKRDARNQFDKSERRES